MDGHPVEPQKAYLILPDTVTTNVSLTIHTKTTSPSPFRKEGSIYPFKTDSRPFHACQSERALPLLKSRGWSYLQKLIKFRRHTIENCDWAK